MITDRDNWLRSVLHAVSWRGCLVSVTLGLLVGLLRWLQNARHAPPNFLYSSLMICNLGALSVMLATLAAEQAVRRGAPPLRCYCAALTIASLFTAGAQYLLRDALHLYTAVSQPGVPLRIQHTQIIFVFFDVLSFGGLGMFAYRNKCTAQRILEEVRLTELRRIESERHLTETSLAAARAMVDPEILLEDLGRVRDLYLRAIPDAERELEAIIQKLNHAVRPGAPMFASGDPAS